MVDNKEVSYSTAEVVRDLTRQTIDARIIGNSPNGCIPYLALPYGVTVHDLERLMPAPVRMRGIITVRRPEDFVTYWSRFAFPGALITFDVTNGRVDGMLSYAGDPDAPTWNDHIVQWVPAKDWRFQAWEDVNGSYRGQVEMAEWLEDRLMDVLHPDAAELMEVITTLQAKKELVFRSAVRLDNGATQLQCDESIQAHGGRTAIEVPEKLVIAVPVYEGSVLTQIEAKIRYRIANGAIKFAFVMPAIRDIKEQAFMRGMDVIRQGVKRDEDQPQVPILRASL